MDYIALITYLVVMIFTPGPNNIMLTTSGANFGFRATVPHMLGIMTGNSAQLILACLGLGVVFAQIPVLHIILSWAGLAYMIYLSWKILGLGAAKTKHVPKPLTLTQAALFQLVNAKAWVIIITVASIFMPKTGEVIMPTLIITSLSILVTFASVASWAAFGSLMRNFLKRRRNQLIFNFTMAGLLLATAVMIVVK